MNSEIKENIKLRNKFQKFSNGITNAYYVWKYCFKKEIKMMLHDWTKLNYLHITKMFGLQSPY